MKYKIFSPAQKLKHIVKQYVAVESLDNISNLLFLPNGGNFIVFNRGFIACSEIYDGNRFEIPQEYSVSIKTNKVKRTLLSMDGELEYEPFSLILVELLPTGFYKLFQKDASLLHKEYMPLEESMVTEYFKDLYTHKSIEEEIAYLNASLSLLNAAQNNERLPIEDVMDAIVDEYHYEVTVQQLLGDFGWSRSTMERQFKKYVGLTPKNFIFVAKFCKTLLAYVQEKQTIHELEYLYSDNSHMNTVFKKLMGISPSEIFKEVTSDTIQIYQLSGEKS